MTRTKVYFRTAIIPFLVFSITSFVSCRPATSQLIPITPSITSSPAIHTQTPTKAITLLKGLEISTTTPTYPRRKTPNSTSSPKPSHTPVVCPPNPFDQDLPDPNLPENYIGRHYDLHDLPQGLEDVGGSIIRESRYSGPEFGLSRMKWQQDRSILYWLERLVCRDSQGHPYFEIVDAIATPPLSDLLTQAGVCFLGDKEVITVIAYGIYDQEAPFETVNGYLGKPYTEIVFAFRVDYTAAKFVELDPDSLMCLEPPGIDGR